MMGGGWWMVCGGSVGGEFSGRIGGVGGGVGAGGGVRIVSIVVGVVVVVVVTAYWPCGSAVEGVLELSRGLVPSLSSPQAEGPCKLVDPSPSFGVYAPHCGVLQSMNDEVAVLLWPFGQLVTSITASNSFSQRLPEVQSPSDLCPSGGCFFPRGPKCPIFRSLVPTAINKCMVFGTRDLEHFVPLPPGLPTMSTAQEFCHPGIARQAAVHHEKLGKAHLAVEVLRCLYLFRPAPTPSTQIS